MAKSSSKKISTDPYKGVRDFFPEDMAIEKEVFAIWRSAVEKYGYQEYGASVLEPSDLYKAKTGDEIVNEQTYTFIDRGEREVTLRPEMTPTVARMIAAKRRELVAPIRWYSIPNLFRYEQPQGGRVREHWQLNVDIFGVDSIHAEVEVMSIAYDIMRGYGLKDTDFEIRINNRKVVNYILKDVFGLDDTASHTLGKLIDKKDKLEKKAFEQGVTDIFTKVKKEAHIAAFLTLLNSKNFEEFTSHLPQTKEEHVGLTEIRATIRGLEELGITNVRFDQTLMRGFDYYTGIVFEVYDMNPANRRSVFGGGRYDELLSLFGNDKMTAVGFGAGDVIARDIMETYKTLPATTSAVDLGILIVGDHNSPYALELARNLRGKGLNIFVDFSGKKLGDQISNAGKRKIPRIICIGDEEVKTGKLRVKNLAKGEEIVTDEAGIPGLVRA